MQVLQVQLEIGSDPMEVGRARRWARSRLAGCGIDADEPLAETLILLISELVTNAVVHTGAPAVLRMLLPVRPVPRESGAVRVEVADVSSRPPRQRQADGDDTNGRGLELVSGLADRWGWEREEGGKNIWCELDCDRPGEPDCAEPGGVGAGTGSGAGSGVGAGAGAAAGSGVGDAAPDAFAMGVYGRVWARTVGA
ncbi:ATP-binding protein [Streptomyces sp. NPDC054796]